MSILKGEKGGTKPSEVGTSAKVYNECGSGSRPTPSKYTIESSAPADPHLIRGDVKGALK